MKTKFVILSLLMSCSSLFAQDFGALVGKVTDKDLNDDPLPFANVILKGSNKGTTTDFDGLFELNDIPAGTYAVEISFVGYETQTFSVDVVANKITEISMGLSTAASALDEVVVTTVARKDSEIALLIEQKNALTIKQQIGAEEFSRKGLGDAAAAVVKTTGVTQQEGSGTIFVRGLGDRYNITSYNGLPVPSNDPSTKNIDLEIFKTDVVQSISIDKTFDPGNYGDYAGASINIIPKEATKNNFTISLGSGINTSVSGLDTFYLHEGPNFAGFYTTRPPSYPLIAYGFHNSLDRKEAFNGMPLLNNNASLQLERIFTLASGDRLTLFATGSFENGFSYKEGVRRGSVNTSGLIFTDYDFQKYQYDTNTTGMLNLGYRSSDWQVKLNSLLINDTEQNQQEYYGTIDVFDYAPEGGAFVQRGEFKRTTLLTNQLLTDWNVNDALEVNLAVGYNTMENDIPDRRQITLTPHDWDVPDGPKSFQQTLNASDNHRFYAKLTEDEWNGRFTLSHSFGTFEEDTPRGHLHLGYNGRFKDIAFEATQFNFSITDRINGVLVEQPLVEDIHNVDSYFNQQNFEQGLFSIVTFRGRAFVENALEPQTYGGFLHINAGYLRLDYKLNPKTDVIVGLRAEDIVQDLNWNTSIDAGTKNDTYFEWLPSFSLRHALTDAQNLRVAFSKSYTLPQFKEKAPFQYEEVGQVYLGNPALYASDNYNVDVKWEWFLQDSNLISVGAFYKNIKNPINGVTINSASNDKSYVNSGNQATALGLELELRQALFSQETETENSILKEQLNVGFNASYMYSDQDLDKEKVLRETEAVGLLPISVDFSETNAQLTGASDFVFNIDASYSKQFTQERELLATLAFNYFSERIFALGTEGRGNLMDRSVPTLDFIFKYNFNKKLSLGLSARNLLNPSIERYQEILLTDTAGNITERQEILIDSFKKGTRIGLSLNYSF